MQSYKNIILWNILEMSLKMAIFIALPFFILLFPLNIVPSSSTNQNASLEHNKDQPLEEGGEHSDGWGFVP